MAHRPGHRLRAISFSRPFRTSRSSFDPVKRSTLQPPEGVWNRGNPGLKPEETTNWSAGIVYSAKFVPGFTVTADWYQIYTTNVIVNGNDFAQVLLTQGVVDPDGYGDGFGIVDEFGPFAGQVGGTGLGITRDASGNLVSIDSAPGNAGVRFVQGVDVAANYELPTTNFGKFTFTLGYNHFFTWKISPGPGLPFNDFLGNYNNGTLPLAPGAIPWNKGFLRGEWEYKLGPGILDFVAQGNYIGSFLDDNSFFHPLDQENLAPPGEPPSWKFNRKVTELDVARFAGQLRVCQATGGSTCPWLLQGGQGLQESAGQAASDARGGVQLLAADALGHQDYGGRGQCV